MKNALLGILLTASVVPSAWACSCPPTNDDQFAKEADNIYFATLQEAKLIKGDSKRWPYIEGRFQVRRSLKGQAPSAPIALNTSAESASCGQTMVVAATYVLFLRNGQTGLSSCDASRIIESFEENTFAAKVKAVLAKKRAVE